MKEKLKNTGISVAKTKPIHFIHKGFNANSLNHLTKILESNTNITSIDLSRNSIHSEGHSEALAKILEKNATITSIDLSFNALDSRDLKFLIPALENNKTITSINLKGNLGFCEGGVTSLAKMLENNKTITSINLTDTNSRSLGKTALLKMLENNKTITSIELINCFGNESRSEKATKLSINSLLERNKELNEKSDKIIEKISNVDLDSITKNHLIVLNTSVKYQEDNDVFNSVISNNNNYSDGESGVLVGDLFDNSDN